MSTMEIDCCANFKFFSARCWAQFEFVRLSMPHIEEKVLDAVLSDAVDAVLRPWKAPPSPLLAVAAALERGDQAPPLAQAPFAEKAVEGKYDEAKAMYERVLASRERTLGADHPETLKTANNLAKLLNKAGDAAAAAALRERFGCA